MRKLVPLFAVLLFLAACSGNHITGKAVGGCTNGTGVGRLCDGDACDSNYEDYGCCPNGYHYCVWQGECYKMNVAYSTTPGYYPKGMFCFRLVQGFAQTTQPRWFDCDTAEGAYCSNRSYCDYYAARAGEEGVGEYNYAGKRECCGDDENEYYIIGEDGSTACCAAPDRVVEAGKCIVTEMSKGPEQQVQEVPPETEEESGYELVRREKPQSEGPRIEMEQSPAEPPNLFRRLWLWVSAIFS